LADVCLMLEKRVRAGDVTSSPPLFNADLRGGAALAWLGDLIDASPLRTAEKTLSYLNKGVAARLAAAEYVKATDVFAPFNDPPDEDRLRRALVRYDVEKDKAKLIAARTCEAVLRKPPPCQQTMQSAFAFASSSVAEPTADAPPPVRPPTLAPPQPPRSSGQSKKKKKKAKPATASDAADFFSGKVRDATKPPKKKKTRKK